MAVKRFGTNAITGLNVGSAGHLIADHELQASVGGRTVVDGAWSTGRNHVTVHEGTAISAMACGRMGGQDHTVYVDGNNVLDTGSVVGTTTMGASPAVVPVDGKFLILGASDGRNKIYDGNHLRDHGPWQPDYMSCQCEFVPVTPASWYSITAATKANPCVLTIGSHKFQVGNYAYISSVGGMTELNDKAYKIVAIESTKIHLDVDSTDFTAYTTGGYADGRFGAAGDYKWGITNIIKMSDDTVVESKLREILVFAGSVVASRVYPELGPDDLWLQEPTTVAADDAVWIGYDWTTNDNDWKAFLVKGADTLYNITGTQGTDWYPGVRLYRTKADGTDFYLEREYIQGDTEVSTFSDATGSGIKIAQYLSNVPDVGLGALYASDATDHGSPPQSSLAAQVGQRIFVNDVDNPRNIHVSGLDGGDYFDAADFIRMPDEVTSLNRVRDRLVASTAMRWYLIDMISGFPQIQEIDCSIGTRDANAIAVNDQGLFFMKSDGIYHLDLAKVTKISRRAIADGDLSDGQAALVTADYGIFIGDPIGAGATAVAYMRDGGWVWHHARETLTHTHLGRNSYGQLLGALPTKIEMLFIGSDYEGTFTGKKFSDGDTWRTTKLIVDIECSGAATLTYQITTNRGGTLVAPQTYTLESTTRRIVELPVTRKVGETFEVNMAVDGNATVYGYAIEVET